MHKQSSNALWFLRTCSKRLALGLTLVALLPAKAAFAENPTETPHSSVPSHHPATEAELRDGITQTENLNRDLREKLAVYQEHLHRALETYGHGFLDPDNHLSLPGFDEDIRTGNPAHTEEIRRAVFASVLVTSGVHLDPDPLHDWAEVEKDLNQYESLIVKLHSWSVETPALETTRKLNGQLLSTARDAEKARDLVEGLRPAKLDQGQTLAAQSAEGMNLRFKLVGIQFGRELGNVNALFQLTYCGQTVAGHSFLLTALTLADEKTRADTWVRSRTVLAFSDSKDPIRYGHVITAQDHGDYRVLSARIADVAPRVRDWVWKSLALLNEPLGISELEAAKRRVQDSQHAIDTAIAEFQHLALSAVRQNDAVLTSEASARHRKVELPEQDLKLFSPYVRAQLYAIRALSARDPRFLAALDDVNEARRGVETSINDGSQRFAYCNGLVAYQTPELPWRNIQKLAAEFMNAAEDARRASEHATEALPLTLKLNETAFTFHSTVLVEQVNRGPISEQQQVSLMTERILRDVHWAVKGIPRREYVAQIIEVSPETGVHRVQKTTRPAYVQGPGGIRQVFQDLSKAQAFEF